MALIVTSTEQTIAVDFGGTNGGMEAGVWRKDAVRSLILFGNHIAVTTGDGEFQVSNTAVVGSLQVDTVNGEAPSSLADLYAKLAALLG